MSEQTDRTQQPGTSAGCGCGCGGHGAEAPTDERATAPVVDQPLGEGYNAPEPVTASSMETAAPASLAANVMRVLGDGTVQVAVPAQGDSATADDATAGVVPGHKPGNLLGLRDVSAAGSEGGCGCGGHGHHHEHAHGERAGGCACGAH